MTSAFTGDTQPTAPALPAINPWLIRVPLLFLMGGMLLGIALTVVLVLYQVGVTGRIVPGVTAYGVALGGMTQDEAASALDAAFTYDDVLFTFRYGEQFWQVSAGELGVSLDAASTAAAALNASAGAAPAESLTRQLEAWRRGVNVQPVVRYDEAVARAQLKRIAAELDQPPQNAALVINGLEVTTTPPQNGTVLDIDAALAALRGRVTAFQPGGEIALNVVEMPPAITDAESTAAYVRTALSAPLLLIANDAGGSVLGPWRVSPEQIASALDVQLVTNDDGDTAYTVDVDFSGFAPQLGQLAPGLIVPARDGRFTFNDATRQLETLVPAVDGRRLNVAQTIERMEAAAFDVDNRAVQLAFDYTPARYHNDITAAELGITELVSESRTLFTGSTAARRQNIENAASFYNGVMIAPGETFSFNRIVGDISEDNGFVEGAIIFGGRTVKGVGGGVCQVSTTAFRAAFYGGFPIVERYSHGYRVYYYELGGVSPGLDAAIFTPTADFKFVNDTDYHLLIETEFLPDEDALVFRYYSTNPGRVVSLSEPVIRNVTAPTQTIYEPNENLRPGQQLQVDWSQEGGDVVITRTIRDPQGNILERRDFATHYQPWSAVIEVPPGDSRLNSS